nr:PREDICTED: mesoderm posterior protein 2 [Bos mutus]
MAQSPPLQSLLGQDHWIFPQGWGWVGHSDSTSPASSSSDSSGSCPCDRARRPSQPAPAARGAAVAPAGGPAEAQRQGCCCSGSAAGAAVSCRSPPVCSEALAAPERLGSRVPDMGPWLTPPYCPGMQSPPQLSQGRAPDAALWTSPQACCGMQTPPEPRNQPTPWTSPPASLELAAVYQGISVSPESCLLPETPPLLPRPACQQLQPQTQWGCWSHTAEVLPNSEDQGPGPALQLSDESPPQNSGLPLSGCPEFWQEDLAETHLGMFY